MKIHAFRLLPGDDLKVSIQKLVNERQISAGAVVSCVGSLKVAALRMANQKNSSKFEEKFEILSLSGTVATEGSHLHISVSDSSGKVLGGHLMDGNIIFTTAEIILAEFNGILFKRELDEKTGFKELVIKTADLK